jgi:hypothetical protein
MGLLDDAIREHLELKRQHGGNPSEIERQEREAFGAGGRPAAPPEGEADEVAAPDEPAAAAGPDDATIVAPPAGDEVAPPAEAAEDVAAAPAEAAGDVAPAPDEAGPPTEEVAPPPDARDAGREEDPWLVEETADPEPQPEEDVLEETPDFLQETPEHDRLWFEQKPPRDFDWDK